MSKFSALRKFFLPDLIRETAAATNRAPMPDGASGYYAKAIRNLLDDIKEPVTWMPTGYSDSAMNISGKNVSQLEDILKAEAKITPKGVAELPAALQKELAGDVIMEEAAANLAATQGITGRMGGGTGPAMLHELGHVRDMQKHPMLNYMHLQAPQKSLLGETVGMTGLKSPVTAGNTYLAGSSPTILTELMASANANKALRNVNAPGFVHRDTLKRLAPSLGTYVFPSIAQTIV